MSDDVARKNGNDQMRKTDTKSYTADLSRVLVVDRREKPPTEGQPP